MKRLLIVFWSFLVLSSAFAGMNWQEELKSDAVVINGGKMILEEYGIIAGVDETGEATSIQLKIYSEAPANGFISRDNFIIMTTGLYLPLFMEMGEFKEIDQPIGTVDWEFNIYMNKTGFQYELKDNNQSMVLVKETMTRESMMGN